MKLLRHLAVPVAALATVVATTPVASAAVVPPTPVRSASFNGPVRAVTSVGSTIFVAGDFTRATDSRGTVVRNHLAAVSATTGRLLPWHPSANGDVDAIAVSRGKVFVGGEFTRIGKRDVKRLAKLSATTGKVDKGFRAKANGTVRAIALTRTRMFVGGSFTRTSGAVRGHLAAFDRSNGKLRPWHPRTNGRVNVLRLSKGLVFVGGGFSAVNGDTGVANVATLNQNGGRISRAFSVSVRQPVFDIMVGPKRVYVAAGGVGGHLYVYSRSASPLWHKTFDGDADAVTVMDGTVYVGGHWDRLCNSDANGVGGVCVAGGTVTRRLAAFSTGGSRRSGWVPAADSQEGVLVLRPMPKRHTLVAAGAFNDFADGAVVQPGFALFR